MVALQLSAVHVDGFLQRIFEPYSGPRIYVGTITNSKVGEVTECGGDDNCETGTSRYDLSLFDETKEYPECRCSDCQLVKEDKLTETTAADNQLKWCIEHFGQDGQDVVCCGDGRCLSPSSCPQI